MYEAVYPTVLTKSPGLPSSGTDKTGIIKTLEKGTILKYISSAGEWSLFETSEGGQGYCPMQDLRKRG